MQDIIRHLPAVIFEYAIFPNGEQRFTCVSERSLDILGLSADDLMKEPTLLYSIVYPEDRPILKRGLTSINTQAATCSLKIRITIHHNLKWIEFRYADEICSEGIILRRGILQELPAGDKTLADETGEIEMLLEKLPIGVVIQHKGVVVFANSHAHLIIGAKAPGQMVGLNGGEIKVASAPGQGTRFHILLPNRINSIINKLPVSANDDDNY